MLFPQVVKRLFPSRDKSSVFDETPAKDSEEVLQRTVAAQDEAERKGAPPKSSDRKRAAET
ncbi:MAG: hypothetical protein Tsb0032_19480 [Kiloniellaceae bacterium]